MRYIVWFVKSFACYCIFPRIPWRIFLPGMQAQIEILQLQNIYLTHTKSFIDIVRRLGSFLFPTKSVSNSNVFIFLFILGDHRPVARISNVNCIEEDAYR